MENDGSIINVDQMLDKVTLCLMKMSKSFFNHESPIDHASMKGNLDLLKLIFKNKQEFQLHWQNFNSFSPIHLAARHGHLEVVKYLVEYMKLNTSFSVNLSPVYHAINEGHVEIVKYFVKEGYFTFNLYDFAFQRGQLEVLKVIFDCLGVPNVSELQRMCYEAFTLSINLANYGSPTEESRSFKRIYEYLLRRFGLQVGNDHMSHTYITEKTTKSEKE